MLPGPCVLMLVELERLDPRHEESALAVGPQAHIDLVKPSGGRVHREQMHDALSQPQEEHAVVDAAGGLLKLAGRVVEEHEVEIRPVPELKAAELAVAGG